MRWVRNGIRALALAAIAVAATTAIHGRAIAMYDTEAYLKRTAPSIEDHFGDAVAISGQVAVVGAPHQGSTDIGRAHVFIKTGSTWALAPSGVVQAPNGDAGDTFGSSVAVSGNLIAVGAPLEASAATGVNGNSSDNSAANSGAVYVYEIVDSVPLFRAYLKASNTGNNDRFGVSVGISGNTIVVGAAQEDSNATGIDGDGNNNSSANSGAAYVFTLNGGVWSQQAYLKASNTGNNDRFGGAVSISGDTIVIGARLEDSNASSVNGDQGNNASADAGAAYVFARNGSTWTQQAYLKPSVAAAGAIFGQSVGVSGDTVAIGAPRNDASGAAYVYVRVNGAWQQQARLLPSVADIDAEFGHAIAIDGERLVVTAHFDNADAGAAYVFSRKSWWSGEWVESVKMGSFADPGDKFGNAAAMSGDLAVIGVPFEDSATTSPQNNAKTDAGAAFIVRPYLPVADAGPDLVVEATGPSGAEVTLDGSGSSAPYDVAFMSEWVLNPRSAPVTIGTTAISEVTLAVGTHPIELWVDAGLGASDQVTVSVVDTTPPVISLVTPQPVSYEADQVVVAGYSCTDLVGIASCAGTQASGSTLTNTPGLHTFTVNAADVSGHPASVSATWFRKARPVVTWPSPSSLPVPATLTTTQLNATAADPVTGVAVPGTFIYSPAAGTPLAIGQHALSVIFTPTDTTVYSTASGGVTITINQGPSALLAEIDSPESDATDFGQSVSVSGDTMVVGAPSEDSQGSNSGAAFVFVKSNGVWSLQQTLKAATPHADDAFGKSVSISGDTIVVGAPNEQIPNGAPKNTGAAYVFVRSGSTWSQQQRLYNFQAVTPDMQSGSVGNQFGFAVAIDGDRLVVGEPYWDYLNVDERYDRGAVSLFERSGSTWTLVQEFYPAGGFAAEEDHEMGFAVALSGDTFVAGAPGKARTRVYTKSGTTWTSQTIQGTTGTRFGQSVAIDGQTLMVRTTQAGSSAALIYEWSGTQWTQVASFQPPLPQTGNFTGTSVAVKGDTAVAMGTDGQASVWMRSGGVWAAHSTIAASGLQGKSHPVVIAHDPLTGNTFYIGGPMTASSGGTDLVGGVFIFGATP